MPFDPAIPADDAPLVAPVMRSQLTALNDDIQTRAPQAALDAAIAGTSANTNGVGTLDDPFSDPPVTADLEAIRAKLNELITAARR